MPRTLLPLKPGYTCSLDGAKRQPGCALDFALREIRATDQLLGVVFARVQDVFLSVFDTALRTGAPASVATFWANSASSRA